MIATPHSQRNSPFVAASPRLAGSPFEGALTQDLGARNQEAWLSAASLSGPASVYVHIPFCRRLCLFCAARTQATDSGAAVERYLSALMREVDLIAYRVGGRVRLASLDWGGGTPTIIGADGVRTLAAALKGALKPTADMEFAAEIDPNDISADVAAALAESGLDRARIGVQDFSADVAAAIGRASRCDAIETAAAIMRDAGTARIQLDFLLGLPRQTVDDAARTVGRAIRLRPERVTLAAFAYDPRRWRRQRFSAALASPDERVLAAQRAAARAELATAGYQPVGGDHFALPGDPLLEAAREGRLSRCFQGYVAGAPRPLIGIGASAISRLPEGYVQNAPSTSAYLERIRAGRLAGAAGTKAPGLRN